MQIIPSPQNPFFLFFDKYGEWHTDYTDTTDFWVMSNELWAMRFDISIELASPKWEYK